MRTSSVKASNMVRTVNRRRLVNNVQRVLLCLVKARNDGWVSRTSLRVPSASSRVRDLRKLEFGGFDVECRSASELNRVSRYTKTDKQTFYRIVPNSVTVARLSKVLKGVI